MTSKKLDIPDPLKAKILVSSPKIACFWNILAPKSQNCPIIVSEPWNYFPIIRAQTKFNFGGSKADICQTSNLQNGLFFASSNKAFKSLEILKLIKNWILSFRAIYQNVQASVKFWYQIQIIRYFIAAEISHYLITVFYDDPVDTPLCIDIPWSVMQQVSLFINLFQVWWGAVHLLYHNILVFSGPPPTLILHNLPYPQPLWYNKWKRPNHIL